MPQHLDYLEPAYIVREHAFSLMLADNDAVFGHLVNEVGERLLDYLVVVWWVEYRDVERRARAFKER